METQKVSSHPFRRIAIPRADGGYKTAYIDSDGWVYLVETGRIYHNAAAALEALNIPVNLDCRWSYDGDETSGSFDWTPAT